MPNCFTGKVGSLNGYKPYKRSPQNEAGLSLVEVLIAVSILTSVILGFMSFMNHETQSISYLEDKLSQINLENDLRLQLSNPTDCASFLGNEKAPNTSGTADITNSLNRTALSKIFQVNGNQILYDKLKIDKISLEGSSLTSPNSAGLLDLVVYPSRVRTGGGPSALHPIKIKTFVSVAGGYKIMSCTPEDENQKGCTSPYGSRQRSLGSAWSPGQILPEGASYITSNTQYLGGDTGSVTTVCQHICINRQWVPLGPCAVTSAGY